MISGMPQRLRPGLTSDDDPVRHAFSSLLAEIFHTITLVLQTVKVLDPDRHLPIEAVGLDRDRRSGIDTNRLDGRVWRVALWV